MEVAVVTLLVPTTPWRARKGKGRIGGPRTEHWPLPEW